MIREIKILTLREVAEKYDAMTDPRKLVEFWRKEIVQSSWYDSEKEQLVVLSLDSKLKLKTFNLVSIGLANQTLCHSRECYRPVIVAAAAYAVPMHNHPSGVSTPSADDIAVARKLKQAGEIVGIPCLDFIVVGCPTPEHPSGFVSLKQDGLVEFSGM